MLTVLVLRLNKFFMVISPFSVRGLFPSVVITVYQVDFCKSLQFSKSFEFFLSAALGRFSAFPLTVATVYQVDLCNFFANLCDFEKNIKKFSFKKKEILLRGSSASSNGGVFICVKEMG